MTPTNLHLNTKNQIKESHIGQRRDKRKPSLFSFKENDWH